MARKLPKWLLPAALVGGGAFFFFRSKSAKAEVTPRPPSPDLKVPPSSYYRVIDGILKGRPDIVENVAKYIDRTQGGPTGVAQLAHIVAAATTMNRLPQGVFEPGTNRSWTLAVDMLLKGVGNSAVLEKWVAEIKKFGLPRSVKTLETKIAMLRKEGK